MQKMYGLAFPARDHQLATAENGRKALELLGTERRWDLILLDLRMPDMNGVEFIRALRSAPGLTRIPVVLTTAERDGSELLAQARALGVAGVVRKPWKPQGLRELIFSLVPGPRG